MNFQLGNSWKFFIALNTSKIIFEHMTSQTYTGCHNLRVFYTLTFFYVTVTIWTKIEDTLNMTTKNYMTPESHRTTRTFQDFIFKLDNMYQFVTF